MGTEGKWRRRATSYGLTGGRAGAGGFAPRVGTVLSLRSLQLRPWRRQLQLLLLLLLVLLLLQLLLLLLLLLLMRLLRLMSGGRLKW